VTLHKEGASDISTGAGYDGKPILARGCGGGAELRQLAGLAGQGGGHGDADAQCLLGDAYEYGKFGLEVDEVTVLAYCQKAADGGDTGAQCHLGIAYEDGKFGL
jgi:TPR repeat protein